MVGACKSLAEVPESPWLKSLFAKLPSEPFDKAVLELSHKVKVVPTEIDWSDVGSLLALESLTGPNDLGTRVIGHAIDIGSTNTTSYSAGRLVTTLGLDNVIVVDSDDATLIADRDKVQNVREIVTELQKLNAPETQQSQVSQRPWGSWTMLYRGRGYQVKEIQVSAGGSLSLQKHTQRSEHWIVIEGTASVEIDGRASIISKGQSIFIPVGSLHRLANNTDELLRISEVAVGDYLGEDDIERFSDAYGRGDDDRL
jgi:mannose-1-phosphate guanylyltransferase/mannose-6-phosphate isomerase